VVARRDVEAAQTAAVQARARREGARQAREIARAALAREEEIRSRGLRDAREVQQAETDAETARLAARAARSAVTAQERLARAARARLSAAGEDVVAEAAALSQAQSALRAALQRLRLLGAGEGSRLAVRAPIGGVVASRPVNAGEVIAAGQALAAIRDTATVWVESDVFEGDLSRVRVGQRVSVAADAIPGRTFNGTVAVVGSEVHPETRAVRVRTVVANSGGWLKPNMFARVRLATGGPGAVVVPREALQEDGGAQVLFVEEAPGVYRRRPVRAGEALGESVVIVTGVRAGEKVVTRGAYQLLARVKGA
jgi:cobalt-zinc-cadmium efflux system membrane fusion protein